MGTRGFFLGDRGAGARNSSLPSTAEVKNAEAILFFCFN
jgi:hypothetical protein